MGEYSFKSPSGCCGYCRSLRASGPKLYRPATRPVRSSQWGCSVAEGVFSWTMTYSITVYGQFMVILFYVARKVWMGISRWAGSMHFISSIVDLLANLQAHTALQKENNTYHIYIYKHDSMQPRLWKMSCPSPTQSWFLFHQLRKGHSQRGNNTEWRRAIGMRFWWSIAHLMNCTLFSFSDTAVMEITRSLRRLR